MLRTALGLDIAAYLDDPDMSRSCSTPMVKSGYRA